ncbi:MAG: MFS transporter [Brevibacterium sp.]
MNPSHDQMALTRTKRASVASFLGSMLEYYDFNIYAAASALVFNRIFFPDESPAIGLLLAFATFGVAYVARPVGALVLGHFGDRVGRKKVMLFTVILMGSCTFLIGCLPDYSAVGWIATALLVLLRILQGFSAGGEQSGANALILEHAPTRRRNFFTSWTMTGTTAGIVIASLAFLPIAAMPDELLLSWGWRVPFWASVVVIFVAYLVRRKLEEPEAFVEAAQEEGTSDRLPFIDMLRTHWGALLRLVFCAITAAIGSLITVFGLAFATTEQIGIDRSMMLMVTIVANVVAMAFLPAFSALSDKIGRKPVWLSGVAGCAIFTVGYFWSISLQNVPLIFVMGILATSISYSAVIGVGTVFYPEMFATRIRYSGSALGTQIGYALAGFAPTIALSLTGEDITNWVGVAIFVVALCLAAFIAGALSRETFRENIDALGVVPAGPIRASA